MVSVDWRSSQNKQQAGTLCRLFYFSFSGESRSSNRKIIQLIYRYPILVKNKEKDMLGTGHHSILYEPETDKYRIAYHRFVTPLGQFAEGKGYRIRYSNSNI
ncbi:hypothetical protein ACFQ3W_10245 [Paenibacillus puldeungensis]|uniref:Uncharacterized protein n=1 Tax=Paenibacillus puldeungensis TaxID=696536 RepID=A0ABW3RWJ9_9BACL